MIALTNTKHVESFVRMTRSIHGSDKIAASPSEGADR